MLHVVTTDPSTEALLYLEQEKCQYKTYNKKALEDLLPHRGPALHLDCGYIPIDPKVPHAWGERLVQEFDHEVSGHFPGNPVLPGWCLDEIARLTSILALSHTLRSKGGRPCFPMVLEAHSKYLGSARPGDLVFIRSVPFVNEGEDPRRPQFACEGFVKNKLIFESTVKGALVPCRR